MRSWTEVWPAHRAKPPDSHEQSHRQHPHYPEDQPITDVVYLGLLDPTYTCMSQHLEGLTTYGLLEMTADLERRVGHPCPQVTTVIATLDLTADTLRSLSVLELS